MPSGRFVSGSSKQRATGAFSRWWNWLQGRSPRARARLRTEGLDVVIQGEPAAVHRLVKTVRRAMEAEVQVQAATRRTSAPVVQPRELDEADSPYALPEAAQLRDRQHLKPVEIPAEPDTEPPQERTTVDAPEGWLERTEEAAFSTDPSEPEVWPRVEVSPRPAQVRDEHTERLPRRRRNRDRLGSDPASFESFEGNPTPAE